MLFEFYYNTIGTVSITLFYILIGLLISILVVNNKLYYYINKQDKDNFEKLLKTQKALIWANFSISILFFLYLLIVSISFFTSSYEHVSDRRSFVKTKIIMLFFIILIFTGLTYYIHNDITNINLLNVKDESTGQILDIIKKIYIIIPIISIITIAVLMYNFKTVSQILTYTRNVYQEERYDPVSVTLTVTRPISSASRSRLYSGLNNRQSPYTPNNTPPYF